MSLNLWLSGELELKGALWHLGVCVCVTYMSLFNMGHFVNLWESLISLVSCIFRSSATSPAVMMTPFPREEFVGECLKPFWFFARTAQKRWDGEQLPPSLSDSSVESRKRQGIVSSLPYPPMEKSLNSHVFGRLFLNVSSVKVLLFVLTVSLMSHPDLLLKDMSFCRWLTCSCLSHLCCLFKTCLIGICD